MSDELTVTKENVLKAARKCGEARTVLKELFPGVFEKWGYDITASCRLRSGCNDDLIFIKDSYGFSLFGIPVKSLEKISGVPYEFWCKDGKIIGEKE